MDDVFDDDPHFERKIWEKTEQKIQEQMRNLGMNEGIEQELKTYEQSDVDQGFKQGCESGFEAGCLLGKLIALEHISGLLKSKSNDEKTAKLNEEAKQLRASLRTKGVSKEIPEQVGRLEAEIRDCARTLFF
eukprot:TRINITY_DN7160_c0_g1_i1.p1 TRINITY_DN7160_c0_g1~~TRINITY_DN7160_c0_g1_i1.p1  ORF type:complete len:132 (+),score=31.89 TRINITY_DN7160_c0_g1_i1:126-521(+)